MQFMYRQALELTKMFKALEFIRKYNLFKTRPKAIKDYKKATQAYKKATQDPGRTYKTTIGRSRTC